MLSLLGDIAFQDGRREEALDLLMQSAELADQVGSRWLRIGALLSAAEYALQMDRPAQGRDVSLSALTVARAIGDRQRIAYALTLLAWAAAELGQPLVAGRVWGAIEAESARAPFGQWEGARESYDSRVLVAAGPDFDRGRAEGLSLTLDEAAEEALAS